MEHQTNIMIMNVEANLVMEGMDIIYIEKYMQSGVYGYNKLEQVYNQSLTSTHLYYLLIREIVRSLQEIYE